MELKGESKIIFDININSIQDLYSILLNKWYDFLTVEPEEDKVSIKFRKDWKVIEERFIKYPIYSEIVIKAKTISNLDVWVTKEVQEWKWEIEFNNKKYISLAKVVPWNTWEKMFLKLKETEQKKENKNIKKIETSKLLWFFWVMLIILLIVGWGFLSFIVINAKTIEDVKFFLTLWVNLNEINNFIAKTVHVFFSLLVSLLTMFLVIFLFKFLTTKKIFKKKKATYWVLSILIFILTFSTATWWMALTAKINKLPEWDILALGDIQVYDNSKLKSWKFTRTASFITDTTKLIWPIDIKFDLTQLVKKEERWWLKIQKYIWDFWWDIWTEEWTTPELIKKFDKKWNYNIEVTIELIDNLWEITRKKLKNIPVIWIQYLVWIREKELNSGWKQVTFDASSLKELWTPEWFTEKWGNEAVRKWSTYITNPIFEETIIWLYLRNENKKSEELDRIFIIDWEQSWKISWEIEFSRSPINDREFTFRIKNPKVSEWSWFIEKFKWNIEWKEYIKEWDLDEQEKSSEIKHIFSIYWRYEVSVEMTPTSWEVKKISKTIDIWKELKIKEKLRFYNNSEEINDVNHSSALWEYFIRDFWVPSKLSIDSRYIKSDNIIYSLEEVEWDFDNDWNIDSKEKKVEIPMIKEWRNIINVNYRFRNIRIEDDFIDVKEKIYVESVKKDADITFKINQNTEYAPAIIWFDATKSSVKDSNISKFIWDFGDWIIEESDAVIEWHRYLSDWEYNVSLTVVTSDWKRYSTSKKVILKPKAQRVKIKSSMKQAPVFQWIDFDSSDSIWDIVNYLWDFGDWEISTEANPTHIYKKTWEYKVKLKVDFRNRNISEDSINITITN